MTGHIENFRKLCYHFPKKSPQYLLKMLRKYNGDYETTVDAIQKDGNHFIKFFRNLASKFRTFINDAKSKPFQEDERNEVFEVNIGQHLANTLREKFENSTSLRVPEGFEPVISMPASMGRKLYLLYAESVFHQEETQKLGVEVRLAREDEEFARRIQENEKADLEETKKKIDSEMMRQPQSVRQGDEELRGTNLPARVVRQPVEPSVASGAVPKRSAKSVSKGRHDANSSLSTCNNQSSTPVSLNPQTQASAVEPTDSYIGEARSILAKYKMVGKVLEGEIKSQQCFIPGSPSSTGKPKLSREEHNEDLITWSVEDIFNTCRSESARSQPNVSSKDTLGFYGSLQLQSRPVTKIKSKLQQFVNPVSPLALTGFESEIIGKNSQELQPASHYRDEAQKHLKNKQKYEDMAKNLLQDDRRLSHHYFHLSKQEAKNWEESNHMAALMFLSENLENSPRSNILDLHHLYVKEALQCLDVFLDKEICLLQVEAETSKKLSIITGRGKHSLHGIAKIKPEVISPDAS